jgi:hypothetical protein
MRLGRGSINRCPTASKTTFWDFAFTAGAIDKLWRRNDFGETPQLDIDIFGHYDAISGRHVRSSLHAR